MVRLVRRSPVRDIDVFNEPFERMVNDLLRPMTLWAPESMMAWSFPVDVYEDGDDVVVVANVAGVDSERLHVELDEDTYRIWGEVNERHERAYHLQERRVGRFERRGSLPARIDRDRVHAEVEKGVLTVRAHKADDASSREIKVHVKE
jgi:HSP20 family protein